MQQKISKWFILCMVMTLLLACGLPFNLKKQAPTENSALKTAVYDMIFQTHIAQTSVADPVNTAKTMISVTQTETAQNAPPVVPLPLVFPSETPAPPLPTPAPLATPTEQGVFLTLSQNSYCRTDPNTSSTRITTIMAGVKAKVVGRTADYGWYYVDNPNAPGNYCWVWAAAGTVTGDQSTLKVITP